MTDRLKAKLKNLPAEPGIYLHRNDKGKIIYIGKAAILKNRVMSYFRGHIRDAKTAALVAEIADTEWITVGSEAEALFLESEFVKRYRPKFNIDLKDDKNFIYVKISADEFPVVSYVRRPMDDRAHYYGPFTSSDPVRRAMRLLRKVFPYVTHEHWPTRGCLQFHLGLCPGPEAGAITAANYRRSVKRLEMYLKGQKTKVIDQIARDMAKAATKKDYETAAKCRDQIQDLKGLGRQIIFGDAETFDLTRDQALTGLSELLGMAVVPRRIEAYDISHLGGTGNVASMIVFSDGLPNRDEYRKFKMRTGGNNDVGHIREVITRRVSAKNLADWPKPDLILIDGGQPQLTAAVEVLAAAGLPIPTIGLAKRLEEIVQRRADGTFLMTQLPPSSHVLQLLQRVRDEAHRFAITYQSVLQAKRATASLLDSIPGIGPATRKALIKRFGSVRGVKQASLQELATTIGPAKAKVVVEHLGQAETPATPAETPTDADHSDVN